MYCCVIYSPHSEVNFNGIHVTRPRTNLFAFWPTRTLYLIQRPTVDIMSRLQKLCKTQIFGCPRVNMTSEQWDVWPCVNHQVSTLCSLLTWRSSELHCTAKYPFFNTTSNPIIRSSFVLNNTRDFTSIAVFLLLANGLFFILLRNPYIWLKFFQVLIPVILFQWLLITYIFS